MVAAEDATTAANTAAAAMPRSGVSAKARSTWATRGLSLSGSMPSIMSFRPRKMRPKPRTAWPRSLKMRRRAKNRTLKPRPTRSGA
jgi:hypothetical protein